MGKNRIRATAFGAFVLLTGATACADDHDDVNTSSAEAEDSAGGEIVEGDLESGAPGSVDPGAPVFEDYGVNPTVTAAEDPQSTFALDVDTGSYTIARNYIEQGLLPDRAAVRTEELVNYFPQDYAPPDDGIAVHVDGTAVPFLGDPSRRVVRVGLQAATVSDEDRPPAVLTFVVDTSGSMGDDGKLDMVRAALDRLVDALRPDDRIGIVTFSGDAEVRLESTPVDHQSPIREAIDGLAPGNSTNVAAGLELGYEQARAYLEPGAINRVVLLSDGVANTGQTDPATLAADVQEAAADEIQLVTVGVGMGTYNDVVMEQLADQGDGFYAYVDGVDEAERLFVEDLTGTLQVVAQEARVQVTFDSAVVTSYRLLGFENRQVADEEFRDDDLDGGEVGAGHSVTALYEVTLPEGGEAGGRPLLTATVLWVDPETDEAVERSSELLAGDVADSFGDAPPRLRQDVLVAAFAESLRGAPWAELLSLRTVADNAAALASTTPDDPLVAELADLTAAAADLAGDDG